MAYAGVLVDKAGELLQVKNARFGKHQFAVHVYPSFWSVPGLGVPVARLSIGSLDGTDDTDCCEREHQSLNKYLDTACGNIPGKSVSGATFLWESSHLLVLGLQTQLTLHFLFELGIQLGADFVRQFFRFSSRF